MSIIRSELIDSVLEKSYALIDYNIHDNMYKQHDFEIQTVIADESLTEEEKLEALRIIDKEYNYNKSLSDQETKICVNCQEEYLTALNYCGNCIQDYLEVNFSNWTSENDDIDDLIQKCQLESFAPNRIIEWIPYKNLQDIGYLNKGGCSEIYSADWIDGPYNIWNPEEKQLKRLGKHKVILKKLENVESAGRNWFEEAKSYLIIGNKCVDIVQSFGLTQDISGKFMLVMNKMDIDLRKYLQQNYNQITWNIKIQITFDIIIALHGIHKEKAIHRDLHSGNILYSQTYDTWSISELGFCGPVDIPLESAYGNLPYIAPEVISGQKHTFASDIYSIAMIMWEISSGQPPFIGCEHDYDLAMNIINGIRPEIVIGTPLEYAELMEQCWDADSTKRPNINTLWDRIEDINKSYYQNNNKYQTDNSSVNNNDSDSHDSHTNSNSVSSLIRNFSKIYNFKDLPEPRNANKDVSKNQNMISVAENLEKEDLYKSKKIKQNYNNSEIYINREVGFKDSDDNVESYINPNLHSEDQDELEIPEDIF
ncbi:kinase-like domain-containing protein [Glomus cerebriforme]|uniref:Kinase-like domain-containing protein n=1 Tax=Glomus cerebriforme TaxID=658196 RepID=A0A397T9C5_9GLOM|nr:kinase-like domain-containing protein [Glomus cerebriforme]